MHHPLLYLLLLPTAAGARIKRQEEQDLLGPFPPAGLTTEVVSSTEVKLTWEDQELQPNALPPPDRTYTVKYGRHGSDGRTEYELVRSDTESVVVKGLRPDTEYEFSVKVDSDRGQSAWSLISLARTYPAAPSSAPFGFKIVSSSARSVEISWKPPKEPNGPLTGYNLYYTEGEEKRNLKDWTKVEVPADTTHYRIRGLGPGMLFVKLGAVNSEGTGPLSPSAIHSVEADVVESPAHNSAFNPAAGLTLTPGDKEMEKKVGDFLTVLCGPRDRSDPGSSIHWSFPNGTRIPKPGSRQRVYGSWAEELGGLRLVFVETQYEDTGVYTCTRTATTGQPTRRSFVLRVLAAQSSEPRSAADVSCDFESGSEACGWAPDSLSPLLWQRIAAGHFQQGMTLLLPNDHTLIATNRLSTTAGGTKGHYMYLQSRSRGRGVGRLLSPSLAPGLSFQSCLTFAYYVASGSAAAAQVNLQSRSRGRGVGRLVSPSLAPGLSFQSCLTFAYYVASGSAGTLKVSVVGSGKIFETGELLQSLPLAYTNNQWKIVTVNLRPSKEHFRIVIEVEKKSEEEVAVAVDDIHLSTEACTDQPEEKSDPQPSSNRAKAGAPITKMRSKKNLLFGSGRGVGVSGQTISDIMGGSGGVVAQVGRRATRGRRGGGWGGDHPPTREETKI